MAGEIDRLVVRDRVRAARARLLEDEVLLRDMEACLGEMDGVTLGRVVAWLDAEEVHRAEWPLADDSPKVEVLAEDEGPAGGLLLDRVMAAARAARLPGVPEVGGAEPVLAWEGEMPPAVVRRIYDYAGVGPKALARRAGAPGLYRNLRKFAHVPGRVREDTKAWLLRVSVAMASDPEVAAWQRRVTAVTVWRQELVARLNRVVDEVREVGAPSEARVLAWEDEVVTAARGMPGWMVPRVGLLPVDAWRGSRDEGEDPVRELLG